MKWYWHGEQCMCEQRKSSANTKRGKDEEENDLPWVQNRAGMQWRRRATVRHASARAGALAPGEWHRGGVAPRRRSCRLSFVPVEGRKREMGGKGKGSGEGARGSNSNTNGKWHACFHTPQIKLCSQPLQSAIFCLSQFCIVDCPISHEIK